MVHTAAWWFLGQGRAGHSNGGIVLENITSPRKVIFMFLVFMEAMISFQVLKWSFSLRRESTSLNYMNNTNCWISWQYTYLKRGFILFSLPHRNTTFPLTKHHFLARLNSQCLQKTLSLIWFFTCNRLIQNIKTLEKNVFLKSSLGPQNEDLTKRDVFFSFQVNLI